MKDYLTDLTTNGILKNPYTPYPQNPQKGGDEIEKSVCLLPSKPSEVPFEGFEGTPHRVFSKIQVPPTVEPAAEENIEMHNSALFDVVVEVDFYAGRRLWILQQSTPPGWSSPF